ncbi:MAG: MarR family winged helix-turn-helix transcriptional regulator [Gammaproteobacteria bacterium]
MTDSTLQTGKRGGTGDAGKQPLRVWLRLLACENIIENRIRTAMRERFGITLPQFDVLAELEYLGAPLTMTELSKRLMVSNGNVTGVVDRLVREGYVERRPSPNDRRVQLISLTPDGLRSFRNVAGEHERWVAELFSGMAEEEVSQLAALLTRAHESLKTKTQESMSE